MRWGLGACPPPGQRNSRQSSSPNRQVVHPSICGSWFGLLNSVVILLLIRLRLGFLFILSQFQIAALKGATQFHMARVSVPAASIIAGPRPCTDRKDHGHTSTHTSGHRESR